MPELRCTVQTCVHNKQFVCDLDKIEVAGEEARTARETCCDSFRERTSESYSNVADSQPSEMTGIYCKATECEYNHDCDCHAGRISVEGSNACHCENTECATFSYRG